MADPPNEPPAGQQPPPMDPAPLPPPVLNYNTPAKKKNSVGLFLWRAFVGALVGFASLVIGVVLSIHGNMILFYIPPGLAILAAVALLIFYRRYGYVTGVLAGTLLVVVGLGLLLTMICGGGHL